MFIETIRPNPKEVEQEYITESGIDLEEFIKAVRKFDSLDEALALLKESIQSITFTIWITRLCKRF